MAEPFDVLRSPATATEVKELYNLGTAKITTH
jgi:hypothetical protein